MDAPQDPKAQVFAGFCTECGCFFQTAGTCNCYAPAQPPLRIAPVWPVYPTYPYWYVGTPWGCSIATTGTVVANPSTTTMTYTASGTNPSNVKL